ncbi:hypothetical protein A2W14_06025 [Candidatus Gottesmanbacteria bacterium RBG_16_37_8]|uniref:SIS domain-containing protein n=1 Tax=Candidatus Gottesmanbacteria bacterium RBG_16_37_8 TaxID=1798371 RepID=A0A1F5YNJ4_9BACT|nr:MAG: hypothetical protein A2W14_06025 [Candidatus Gottesmanbacteria bacterium RBG_16_37_8]
MKTGLADHLDNEAVIKKLDPNGCLSSVKNLSSQIEVTWQEVSKFPLNISGTDISSIYFCGMGGSSYAGRIIKSLYFKSLNVPVEIVDNYHLPQSVNKKSLIICASYSGDTEETLSVCYEALAKNLPLIGVSSGGKLSFLLKKNNRLIYNFKEKFNPSGQPRLGQGYMITSQLSLLSKLNLIRVNDEDVKRLISFLNIQSRNLDERIPLNLNQAKQIARKFSAKIVNLVASEFLEGVLHAVRNPLNETGKHFANYFILPELNHHLLEGLKYPKMIQKSALFVFLESAFYSSRIKKRMTITKEVVAKIGIDSVTINLSGKSQLEQVFELLQLFSFVSFYLAMVHKLNPAPVLWVDYFKKKLSS